MNTLNNWASLPPHPKNLPLSEIPVANTLPSQLTTEPTLELDLLLHLPTLQIEQLSNLVISPSNQQLWFWELLPNAKTHVCFQTIGMAADVALIRVGTTAGAARTLAHDRGHVLAEFCLALAFHV